MEVITIEKGAYKLLIQRIENIESMLLSITKMNRQKDNDDRPEYITREQAKNEFQISFTAIDKRIKKYNVSRLPAGGKRLLNRLEFIRSLHNKEPFDQVINKGKDETKT